MAVTLQDLDQIIGYDPTDHSVAGMPTVRNPTQEAARRANAGIADLAQQKTVGIPSLSAMKAPTSPVSTGIPDLRAPMQPGHAQESMTDFRANQSAIDRPQFAPLTPGQLGARSVAAPEMPAAAPGGGIPNMAPSTPDLQKPKQSFWQKLGHGLETAGNIAGDIVAPGEMALIPGTQMNKRFEESRAAKLAGEGAETELKKAQTEGVKAGWQPMTVTGPNGEQITVPARFAGTLEAANLRGQTAEDIQGKRGATAEDIAGKRETGAETRTQENIAGRQAAAETAAAAKPPKTLTMLDREGGKPYQYQYDPTKTYSGDEGMDHWKKVGPAQPNAMALGLVGSYQPTYNAQTGALEGFYNTKEPNKRTDAEGNPIAASAATGTTGTGARLSAMQQNRFNTQYVNPANQAEQQYQRATQAVQEYNANPKTGAAAMVLFAQHLGTTLGGIKGAAIGEGAQKMHQDAIGLEDRASRFMDYLKTGQPLSANQVHDFYDLIQKTRNLQWVTAAREGARRQVPIDFLPPDVKIKISSPDGKESTEVPANLVQKYVDKGGKIEY